MGEYNRWAMLGAMDQYDVINPDGRNVRFWYFLPGYDQPVRLTLVPGQVLVAGSAGSHDEGWERTDERLYYDGEHLFSEVWTDGTDCDGRMSSYRLSQAVSLAGNQIDRVGVAVPTWRNVSCRHRDYAAEAAGY